MQENEERPKDLISVPGVRGEYPKYWGDKEALYYCDLCTDPPADDDPNKIAVTLRHDDCVREKAKYGLAKMIALNDRLQAEIDALTNQMANDILRIDPDAQI
ncbi:hypothetical protein HY948_01510 [Candidatus Gottesmanbacteria bacterium]|nr:hypothetical protein [Candidatus Gottesmanbacteria bacterium]